MGKIYFHTIYQLIIIIPVLITVEIAASERPSNILSSSNTSIRLKHWQAVKDINPKNPIPEFPDSIWQPVGSGTDENLFSGGNWILRTDIIIVDSVNDKMLWGLFPINLVTAYELYWDGIKIGQNGIVGTNK